MGEPAQPREPQLLSPFFLGARGTALSSIHSRKESRLWEGRTRGGAPSPPHCCPDALQCLAPIPQRPMQGGGEGSAGRCCYRNPLALPPACSRFQGPALAAPCLAWIFAPRGPALRPHLTHPLLQLQAQLGHRQTPRKHGPIARAPEVAPGEHASMSQSPHLFNRKPLWFQVTPLPSMHL